MSSIFPVCLLSHQASAIPLPVFRGEMRRISETIPCDYLPLPLRHVRPVQSQHEARVITLFLRVQELLYRGTSGVVA